MMQALFEKKYFLPFLLWKGEIRNFEKINFNFFLF